MKTQCLILTIISIFFLFCGTALAVGFNARGSAVVNGVKLTSSGSTTYIETRIYVTNITGSQVTGRVTIYDQDGNDVTSYCSVYTGDQSSKNIKLLESGTGTFELPAASTRVVRFCKANLNKCIVGHAVIEWSSDDTHLRKALIATSMRIKYQTDQAFSTMVTANGGNSF